ncbi:MAG: penicillin-binding protein 2, partial [Cellvibrionales bacterium]|nr:penicillin-binding protein 2 [Cellvibrionales bacterium]
MSYGALPDKIQESRLVSLRLIVIFFFVLMLISILVVRYYFLQIVHHETYHTKSDSNRVFLQRIPPSRGLITDRQGRLIAENQPAFLLTIVPDKVVNLDVLIEELGALDLASDEDVDAFYKRKKRQRSFEQVPLRFDLSDEEIARVVANRPRLKGVEIKADLLRFYPYG